MDEKKMKDNKNFNELCIYSKIYISEYLYNNK